MDIIDRIILDLGGPARHGAVGRACGKLKISPQGLWSWRRAGIPLERCPDIEALTDGRITRHDMRPDKYGTAAETLQRLQARL